MTTLYITVIQGGIIFTTALHGSGGVCAESHIFTHPIFNDLTKTFMISFCFRHNVINGQIGQPQKAQFSLFQPARAVWPKLGNSASQFFVKSVVFFISHVSIFHQYLLLLQLSAYAVSTVHRVKNLYLVITNGVIEYFNRITRPIEANKTVFIAVAFQQTVANSGPTGMDDVLPRYPVLERRRHKYNFRLHSESIAQNSSMINKGV